MNAIDALLGDASATPALCDSIAHMSPDGIENLLSNATQTAILDSYVEAHPFGADHVAHNEVLIRVMLPQIFREVGHCETVTRSCSQKYGSNDNDGSTVLPPSGRGGVKHSVTFKNVRVQVPTVGSTDAQPRGLKVSLGGSTEKLMPEEALVRGMTYALTVTADIDHRAYDLAEVPAEEFPVLPIDIPHAFLSLPTVWTELRRRTALWDIAAGVPETLDEALDRDAIAFALSSPATVQHPSQLLETAVASIDTALGSLHGLLVDWTQQRALREGRDVARSCPQVAPVGSIASIAADAVIGGPAPAPRFQETLRPPAVSCYDLPIFAFPCMLGTSFDNEMKLPPEKRFMREAPGTFICRGTLKCLRSQKVQRSNVWVIEGTHLGDVTASVRSVHPEKFRSSSTLYAYLVPGACGACTLTLDVPYLPNLPVVAVFRFLGFHHAHEIEALVFPSFYPASERWRYESEAVAEERRRFATNFSSAALAKPLDELYEAAGRGMKKPEETMDKRRRQVHMQITTELLPQVGFDDSARTRMKKGLLLGFILRELLKVCVVRVSVM
jgi:DNA-directed RNA polymerase beta subunit